MRESEKIANPPPQPVILSEAKNPAYGAKTLRFAQGDRTGFAIVSETMAQESFLCVYRSVLTSNETPSVTISM